jgi:hypothetical protein
VKAPQADAHAGADEGTPVVHTFQTGERLSVDEHSTNGWRRVRLSDGSIGYVQDAAIDVEGGAVEPLEAGFPTVEATVKVFELKAHERANAESPVVSTFTEGTKLQVGSKRQHGWRKARLIDGGTAFVEENGLTLPPTPPSVAHKNRDDDADADEEAPKARIYIKNLDHLATLVQSDPKVYPLAHRVATNHTAGIATMLIGGIGGTLLWVGSLTLLAHNDCFNDPCTLKPNWPAFTIGAGASILGPLIGLAMLPSRGDVLDVINLWNTRHPDNQISLGLDASK